MADAAFGLFDRDGNGDVTLDEAEQACGSVTFPLSYFLPNVSHVSRDFHREQLSIEHSMRDLDSAVGRLDNLLMSVYVVVAALIIAVTLVRALYYIGYQSPTCYVYTRILKSLR